LSQRTSLALTRATLAAVKTAQPSLVRAARHAACHHYWRLPQDDEAGRYKGRPKSASLLASEARQMVADGKTVTRKQPRRSYRPGKRLPGAGGRVGRPSARWGGFRGCALLRGRGSHLAGRLSQHPGGHAVDAGLRARSVHRPSASRSMRHVAALRRRRLYAAAITTSRRSGPSLGAVGKGSPASSLPAWWCSAPRSGSSRRRHRRRASAHGPRRVWSPSRRSTLGRSSAGGFRASRFDQTRLAPN
jgi:hypothetical protein